MILVTGGTGFVGQRVVRELAGRGQSVRCLVRRTSDLAPLRPYAADFCYGDITQPESLGPAVQRVEAVVHLVAVIREKGGATFETVNHQGTRNLVQAATNAGVTRFLLMGNLGTVPDPRLPFLYSKWQAEQVVMGSGMKWSIFRSSIMFGAGDGFFTVLAGLIRKAPLVPVIGLGDTLFQPVSVDEVARCLAQALEDDGTVGRVLDLAGPEQASYGEIIDLIMEEMGVRKHKLRVPVPVMRPIVWLMERVLPEPPVTSRQLDMLKADNVTSLDAVERAFGFRPTRLRDGLRYLSTAPGNGISGRT